MIRDLAEETVDGLAFDDLSASSMLAIIGRQVRPGLCLIGLFKVPMIRDLAEQLMDCKEHTENVNHELHATNVLVKTLHIYRN